MSIQRQTSFQWRLATCWVILGVMTSVFPQSVDRSTRFTEDSLRSPLDPEADLTGGAILGPQTIDYDKPYDIGSHATHFNAPHGLESKDKLIVTLVGSGEVDVSVLAKGSASDAFQLHTVAVTDSKSKTVIVIDQHYLTGSSSSISLRRKSGFGDIKATFAKKDRIDIIFGQTLKAWTFWTTEVPVSVAVGPDVDPKAPNRLQFILESSMDAQALKGDESLEMFINKSPGFPNRDSFETRASGYLGTGLVKTITKTSSLYCVDPTCSYRTTIYVKRVDSIVFLPTILPNGSPIQFQHTLSLLEEVEVSEQVEYVLEVPVTDDTWVFTLLPFEGNVQVFINPDTKESKVTDYKYRATSHRAEEIVITKKEGKAFGFKGDRFHVAFKSSDQSSPATFKFSARRIEAALPVPIAQNYAETGVVAHDEIVNFEIDLSTAETEVVSVEFRLESFHGSANLYVKECLDKEVSCVVGKEDTSDVVKTGRIFRMSKADRGTTVNKVDFILLQFTCLKSRTGHDDVPTKYPRSLSCRFAVGVECGESSNNYGTYYKLTGYGRGHVSDLSPSLPNLIRMYPKDKERFRVFLGPASADWTNRLVFYKFAVMTGKFRAFFSSSNSKPDQGSNDATVEVENDNYSSVHTKRVTGSLSVASQSLTEVGDGKYLYLSVESDEYSSFELEIKFSQEELSDNTIQYIQDKKIINREISEESEVRKSPGNDKMVQIGRKFLYLIPHRETMRFDSHVKVHVTSNRVGLEICARVIHREEYEPASETCDFSSHSDLLSIPKSDSRMNNVQSLLIEVLKTFEADSNPPKLPIHFSLKLDDPDNYENIELVHPGHSISATLNPGMSQDYILDIGHATRNVGLYFASVDPDMTVYLMTVSGDARISVGTLNDKKVGLKVNDVQGFRTQYCPSTECKLYLSVFTQSTTMHRYSLMFTVDDSPIRAKEGEAFRIANNEIQWFLFDPDDRSPISFSVHNQVTQTQVFARLMDLNEHIPAKKGDLEALLAMSFDFKSDVDKDPQIVVPLSFLKQNLRKKLLVVVRPVLDVNPPDTSSSFELVSVRKTMDVHLHSKLLKLNGFYQTKGSVAAGEFVYYYFNVDEPGDFAVILTVSSGNALLFLSKDAGALPTQHRFWKRGTGAKSDEVIVTKDEFLELKPTPRQFHVGVFGKEASHFKVLFMPDFKNLVHVKFQTLNEFEVDPDKKFYLAYTNVRNEYDTLLYSEGGDVEVSALNYDDSQSNFVSMVTEEANFFEKFTFKKGDLPRKRHFQDVAELDSQTIVRVRAKDSHCRVFFAIYDSQQPIEISAEKQISFTQNKGDVNVFKVKLGASFDEFEVNFRLEFGSVTARFASDLVSLKEATAQRLSIPGHKVWAYKAEGLPRSNDILIFKEVYVEVSSSEFSRFDLLVKPKEKFLELRAFEPEIVQASSDSDLFVFFTLNPKMLKWVKSLRIDYQSHESFRERPELLFISDAEVTLNPDSPFIPMPMNDLFEKTVADFYHLEVRPAPQAGSYVLKVLKTATPHPIRISVSLNDQRNINPNGIYHGSVPAAGKSHEYSVYLPAEGEYRIVIESCRKVEVNSAEFHGQNSYLIDKRDFNQYSFDDKTGITSVTFNKNFRQTQTYLSQVQVPFKTTRKLTTMLLNIKRGFVMSPGLLRFNITGKGGPETTTPPSGRAFGDIDPSGFGSDVEYTGPSGNTYLVMTEFRPFSKELVFKDYIKLPTKDTLDHHSPTAKFVGDDLIVIGRIPTFTPQLLVDYPRLHFITVKLHSYLFHDPTFEVKYQDCGLACFTEIPHSYSVATYNFSRENLANENHSWTEPIRFNATQTGPFKSQENLHVFCLASVHFYNNEDELHQVSRNSKYTSVPLFFVQFTNESRSFFSAHWGAIILIFLTIVFLVGVFYKMKGSGEEGGSGFAYGQVSRGIAGTKEGGYVRPDPKVEMSTISNKDDSFNN